MPFLLRCLNCDTLWTEELVTLSGGPKEGHIKCPKCLNAAFGAHLVPTKSGVREWAENLIKNVPER